MQRLALFLFIFGLLAALLTPLRSPLLSRAAPVAALPAPPQARAADRASAASDAALGRIAPALRAELADGRKANQRRLVTVQLDGGDLASVERLLDKPARSKLFAGQIQWLVGDVRIADLVKLASAPGVLSVATEETYKPLPAPGLAELRGAQPALGPTERDKLLATGGKAALTRRLNRMERESGPRQARDSAARSAPIGPRPASVAVADIHNAVAAADQGYDGAGVVVALVDTGVDFANAELTGTDYKLPAGPYAGWPAAHNLLSGINYARSPNDFVIGPDTFWRLQGNSWYVKTLPIVAPICDGTTCSAALKIDFGNEIPGQSWPPVMIDATWPDTSVSGVYYYSVHPDFNLLATANVLVGTGELPATSYAADGLFAPAALVVADAASAGAYDTVYVDANFNADLTDDDPQTRASPVAGLDLFDGSYNPIPDGLYDLSAGLLSWIADGTNPPPGTSALYQGVATPGAGRLLAFLGDEDGHGTNCASDVLGQGKISDPYGYGPINPAVGGHGEVGGAGGPVVRGMAQGAKLMAFQNGYFLPDAWILAAYGFDGLPNTGDEAQIVSNSFGYSDVFDDGWNPASRLVHLLNDQVAPNTTWLVATGNGGHGYGTVTAPTGDTVIDVGASTSYGTLSYFEQVGPAAFTSGDVQPWSNRGPGAAGDLAPDVVAVGAWGTGANPLNLLTRINGNINGQVAYDIFGGTSMATPIAAGVLAQIYDAFKTARGRFPTYQEATDLLVNGAYDLGYDPFTQGSGNIDALRSTAMATGNDYLVTPSQWYPGAYRGTHYPGYVHLVAPGDVLSQTFTISNPTTTAQDLLVRDIALQRVAEVTRTVRFNGNELLDSDLPGYLLDLSADAALRDSDMLRVQAIVPLDGLDPDGNYESDTDFSLLFYNWVDLDGDGVLWDDLDGDGFVDEDEIEGPTNDGGEYNRFSYAYPEGNYLEVSLGRTARERLQASDGIFFGIQRNGASHPLVMELRFTYYQQLDWDWTELSQTALSVPAGESATITATLSVPDAAPLGAYQAALAVEPNVQTLQQRGQGPTIIPIVAHVAASSATFTFGAASLDAPVGDTPYANGHVYAAPDWGWRPETGDWRLYYYDVPTDEATPGSYIFTETRWNDPQTDVDTLLYGANPMDPYVAGGEIQLETDYLVRYPGNPAYFGPAGAEALGGSAYTNGDSSGVFRFDTATGGPREVVAGAVRAGLGFVELHHVLSGGGSLGEAVSGSSYRVTVNPTPLSTTTRLLSGSLDLAFSTTAAISEGLSVRAFGLGKPVVVPNQLAEQDDPNSALTASYVFSQTIVNAGLFEVSTGSSVSGLDIDLLIYRDGGDGLAPGQDIDPARLGVQNDDQLLGASLTIVANEQVSVELPQDGLYWGLVHGYAVPGGSAAFDLRINLVAGTDLTVSGVPSGAVAVGARDLQVGYVLPAGAVPGDTWSGLVFLGPAAAPTTIRIPVQITLLANQAPTLSTVARLGVATRGQPYAINYGALAAVANEADADGDSLVFRITATNDGTLANDGVPVVAGTTTLGPGETLVYTPATAGRAVAAFTVVAVDSFGAASSGGVAVTVEVQALVFAPIVRLP